MQPLLFCLQVKSRFPTLSLMNQKGGARTSHYFWVRVDVLAPHWLLMTPQGEGMELVPVVSCGHPAPPQGEALTSTRWARWDTSLQPQEGDVLAFHEPLLVWVGLVPHFFLWLFISFLAYQAAPFLVLWLERAGFCWGSSCAPVDVAGFLASSAPSLGCRKQQENPGNSPPHRP